MFDMPMLAECGDDTLVDRLVTSSANRNSHFVVTSQTVQIAAQFASLVAKFDSASGAVEVIRVKHLTLKAKRTFLVDRLLTALTNVFADRRGFLLRVARMTERSISVANEALIGQLLLTQRTSETFRMPTVVQRSNHSTDHKLTAFAAARSVQYVKVLFTVLATFELVEDGVGSERSKALSAHETAFMPHLTACANGLR
jgi:ribosomal protein L17